MRCVVVAMREMLPKVYRAMANDREDESVGRRQSVANGNEEAPVEAASQDVGLHVGYFTFRDSWRTFAGGVAISMDEFMLKKQSAPKKEIAAMRRDFTEQLRAVSSAFGAHAFESFTPETGRWREQVIAAV